jgi:hypothetical protein
LAVPESVTITHAGELITKNLLEERADTGTGHVILGKAANQSVYIIDRTVPAQHAHQATRTKQHAPSNTHQANVKTLARQRAKQIQTTKKPRAGLVGNTYSSFSFADTLASFVISSKEATFLKPNDSRMVL